MRRAPGQEHDGSPVDVMIEPRPGHSDAEIVGELLAAGADAVEILAPGFVSARILPGLAKQLLGIAHVESKRTKRPR